MKLQRTSLNSVLRFVRKKHDCEFIIENEMSVVYLNLSYLHVFEETGKKITKNSEVRLSSFETSLEHCLYTTLLDVLISYGRTGEIWELSFQLQNLNSRFYF
jgi:hypothetical protein